MPNNPLARYHFVEDHGHPLENCVEYRELLAEVERLRGEVERMDKEADWLAGKLQTLVGPNPQRLESPEPGSMFPKRVVRTWREDARMSVKEEKNG